MNNETELNAAKAENERLTERMKKIEDELTAAWMCGFHKRDDEVARLTKERDGARKGSELANDELLRMTIRVHKIADERDELRDKLAEAEKDRGRLEWLESQTGFQIDNAVKSKKWACSKAATNYPFERHATLRQAIDAAKGTK